MPDEPNGAVAVADDRQQLNNRLLNTPMDMVRLAIDRGVSPDHLGKLLDLAEHAEQTEAKRLFYQDMVSVHAEVPILVCDAVNAQTKSVYPQLETIIRQCKPIWTKYGFSLSFSQQEAKLPEEIRVRCLVRHRAGHSEEHWIDLPRDGIGPNGKPTSMNAVQGVVSSHSYGHRVLTVNIFDIPIGNTDKDGQTGFVDELQVAELKELIKRTGTKEEQFLDWAQVKTLNQIPLSLFGKAQSLLRSKQQRRVQS
jgi:ERF superfamily